MNTKYLLLASLLSISLLSFGDQFVTSPLQGSRLSFVPEKGQTIKKGDALVKFSTKSTQAKVDMYQAEQASAEADLKGKELNLKRYKELSEKRAAPVEKYETLDAEYDKANYDIAVAKSTVESYQAKINMATIPAPYDCKVTEVFLSENSGTDFGQEIIAIAPVSEEAKAINSSENTKINEIRSITSLIDVGFIKYLAKEGSTVKKGEVLVDAINPSIEALTKGYEAEILLNEHLVEATKLNLERYNKLKGKGASIDYTEDIELAYEKAKYKLAWSKVNVADWKAYNGLIKAPFDCKVTKVFLIPFGGTEAGTPIMEIQPIETAKNLSISQDGAISVSSIITEFSVLYLPEPGQAVKKDDILVKLDSIPIDNQITMAKFDLGFAQTDLSYKEKNYKRCKYLKDNNSGTVETCEDSQYAYEMAKAKVEKCKAALSYWENQRDKCFIAAPYNCIVTKVILAVGAGVKFGTPILEIVKTK